MGSCNEQPRGNLQGSATRGSANISKNGELPGSATRVPARIGHTRICQHQQHNDLPLNCHMGICQDGRQYWGSARSSYTGNCQDQPHADLHGSTVIKPAKISHMGVVQHQPHRASARISHIGTYQGHTHRDVPGSATRDLSTNHIRICNTMMCHPATCQVTICCTRTCQAEICITRTCHTKVCNMEISGMQMCHEMLAKHGRDMSHSARVLCHIVPLNAH